ncbi:MAG TPA: TonB-dependent receptor [Longimicrobiales bacterium]|nr:TonB-dependent receptor [Longimicrobiales bacterium]
MTGRGAAWRLLTTMLLAGVVGPMGLPAQSRDIRGVVRDSANHEALPNAFVNLVGAGRRTLTDEFGRFSFVRVGPGPQTLRVEYIGHRSQEVALPDGPLEALTILLVPEAIEIEGLTVQTSRAIVEPARQISTVGISPRQLNALPSVGEPDVFRALQLMPGVSGTNDATSGLYIRGGTPDENLVLLDGMTVYHVDHFFGFFSAFNADAIKDIRLMKGGYPAKYGGRTSSVVEMVGKTGSNDSYNLSAGVNLLSARAVTEVPLGGKGSWLLSLRRSYTDVIRTGLYDRIFSAVGGQEESTLAGSGPGGGFRGRGNFASQTLVPDFYFYDLNSKLTYAPTQEDVVAVSLYSGKDNLDQSSAGQTLFAPDGRELVTSDRIDKSNWGNAGASGRWSRRWGSRFTSDVLAAYSRYYSEGNRSNAAGGLGQGFLEDNRVEEARFRLDNQWQPARGHDISFGWETTHSEVGYAFQQLRGDSVGGSLDLGSDGLLTSLYAEDQWSPAGWLDLTVGVRNTWYDQTGGTYLEPRLAADLQVSDRWFLKAAWGRYHQFVKRVENENIQQGSRDFWVLAGDNLPLAYAEHRIAGITYEDDVVLLDAEAYDKVLDGVSQFSTRARSRPDQELTEFFLSGTGRARGIEFLAQKKRGRLTGWVSYTLSRVDYDLVGFNNDESFPASQDQRHELKVVGVYQLGRWTFGSTWVFGSGKPYTVPEAQYTLTTLDGRELSLIHVGEKNGDRLPAYHRLDVSATRRFESRRLFYELDLSIFNLYGRSNIWYRQFDLSQSPMLVTDVTTLGFTPSIGLRVGLR